MRRSPTMTRLHTTAQHADATSTHLDGTIASGLLTAVLLVAVLVAVSYPVALVLGGASLLLVAAALDPR